MYCVRVYSAVTLQNCMREFAYELHIRTERSKLFLDGIRLYVSLQHAANTVARACTKLDYLLGPLGPLLGPQKDVSNIAMLMLA